MLIIAFPLRHFYREIVKPSAVVSQQRITVLPMQHHVTLRCFLDLKGLTGASMGRVKEGRRRGNDWGRQILNPYAIGQYTASRQPAAPIQKRDCLACRGQVC